MTDLSSIIRTDFPARTIAVVGDLVADQYLNGSIARVSREAPVFILRHDDTTTFAGAAANAAANIASLGAKSFAVGVLGTDASGELLLAALRRGGVYTELVTTSPDVPTTTKVRVLAGHPHAVRQQVIRIDYEPAALPSSVEEKIVGNAAEACRTADAVIISDYNYGVASESVFAAVRRAAEERGIPVIVDSRSRLGRFAGATSATPNIDEAEQLLGGPATLSELDGLRKDLRLDSLVVTFGSKGMTVFRADVDPVDIPAVGAPEALDVTGAGDTVIAAYALALSCGLDAVTAARIANHAGGLVVMKRGTAVVTLDELADSVAADPKAKATVT